MMICVNSFIVLFLLKLRLIEILRDHTSMIVVIRINDNCHRFVKSNSKILIYCTKKNPVKLIYRVVDFKDLSI